MKRSILATAILLALGTSVSAQNAVIRGTVRSSTSEPVGGASVYIAELSIQTASSDAGLFVLTVAGDRVRGQRLQLRARAVGFRPASREVAIVAGPQTVDFTLAQDINRLDEIVVTGVLEGTEQAKVPFAISRVDMADVPVIPLDPLRMLAGRVPGANVVSFSGRPGSSPEIILRGPHSINASGRSQQPLFIVDGVMIVGDLPQFNPADIENVEVVKGAAASSLYGSRGGNGVIQITTRGGRRASEGISWNVRTEYGRSDIERDFGIARNHALIMDERNQRFCRNVGGLCIATLDWLTEAARVNNEPGDVLPTPLSLALDPGPTSLGGAGPPLRNNYQAKRWPGRNYNPVEQAVTPLPLFQTSVDATARLERTQFFASASYLNQAGALRFVDGFRRWTGRLNLDQQMGMAWRLTLTSFYSRGVEDLNSPSFFRLTRSPPIVNTLQRDNLGRLYSRSNIQASGTQNENPLYLAENVVNLQYTRRFLGGGTLRYAPASWIDVEGQFGYDYLSRTAEIFVDKGFRVPAQAAYFGATAAQLRLGVITSGATNAQFYNTGLNVVFRRSFGPHITSRWTLRHAWDRQDTDARSAEGNTLNAVGVPTLDNASIRSLSSSSFQSIRGMSFAAGGNVEIGERYILDGVVRREGSSLFGPRSRWSTFGRVSLAWRISQEPWWFAPALVNDFKLRLSYGTAGGRPQFTSQYEAFTVTGGTIGFGVLGSRELRPEKTFDTELGLDAELLSRVGVNLTWAHAVTRDQIVQVNSPAHVGFLTQWLNAGTLDNKTWELSVNLPIVQRRNRSWTLRFTYDRTRTVISEWNWAEQRWGGTQQATDQIFELRQGELYGTFYGKRFLTSCAELPDHSPYGGKDFRAECGTPTSQFQINSDGYVVWTGGYGVGEGITRNLWTTQIGVPGVTDPNAPWGRPIFWGMPITLRDSLCVAAPSASCAPLQVALGHALPDWNFSVQQTLTWRRLSLYALLQGVMGRDVWNQGRHWAHLDFLAREIDQAGRSVETAKPIGYYWRAGPPDNGAGVGGFYDILAPISRFVEDASYAKLREVVVSYALGPVGGVGNWTVSLVGRNIFTITNYRGFDPEVGLAQGISNSGAVVAVDAFQFPNTRSLTVGVSTTF